MVLLKVLKIRYKEIRLKINKALQENIYIYYI